MRDLMLAVLLVVPLVATAQRSAAPPCPRPPAKSFPAGNVLTISASAQPPCAMEFIDTGVELRPDEKGTVENIGQFIARDRRGRFYSYTSRGAFTVWGPDGTFMRNVGRQGQGPGEFATGPLTIHVDDAHNLYIRDNNMRWSIFGPDYAFLRSFSAAGIGYSHGFAQPVRPGQLLTSESLAQGRSSFFTIHDMSASVAGGSVPPVVRSFGDATAAELERATDERRRWMSPIVGGAFWAGPPEATGRGYELEQWSVDGKLLRTIQREVPWYRKGDDVRAPRGQGTARPKPPTAVISVHADSGGLVYVMVRRTNDNWPAVAALPPTVERATRDSLMDRTFEIYFEVIDTRSGTVLATTGPWLAERARREAIMRFFEGGWTGYRQTETPDGLPAIRIMEMRLVRR